MNLLFHISPDSLLRTYGNIKEILLSNETLIFEAMRIVDNRFIYPSNNSEYISKHLEIENKLRYAGALRGRETVMKLLQVIWNQVTNLGGVQGVANNVLLDSMSFQTEKKDVRLKLTENGYWAIQWSVSLKSHNYMEDVILEHLVFENNEINEVVPRYIVEYIGSAFNCYNEGMNAVAVALVSIAVEATLRDALARRGYSFHPRVSSVDEYPFCKADIEVDGNSYKVTFQQPMPKLASDFVTSSGGAIKAEVDIKRKINSRRTDLIIKGPEFLLDHWSDNTPMRRGVKKVNGLGEALNIARNVEGILNPTILPTDFDEVIQGVRNPLIHLSEATLDKELEQLSSSSSPFTLNDFLSNQEMVFDLIINVPRFINQQYLDLYTSNVATAATT